MRASSSGIRRLLGFVALGVAAAISPRVDTSPGVDASSKSLSATHDTTPSATPTPTSLRTTPSPSVTTSTASSVGSNTEVNETTATSAPVTHSASSGTVRSPSLSNTSTSSHTRSTSSRIRSTSSRTRSTSSHSRSTTSAISHSVKSSSKMSTTSRRSSSTTAKPTASGSPTASSSRASSSHSASRSNTPSISHSASQTPKPTPSPAPTVSRTTPLPTPTPTPTPTPQPSVPTTTSTPVTTIPFPTFPGFNASDSVATSSGTWSFDLSSLLGNMTTSTVMTDSMTPTDISTPLTDTSTLVVTPTNTPTADQLKLPQSNHKLGVGPIVGIVLGVVGGLVAAIILAIFLLRRRRFAQRRHQYLADGTDTYSNPFGSERRYSITMAERDGGEKSRSAGPLVPITSLLSPSTARDPFTTTSPHGDNSSTPVPPYEFGSSVTATPRQRIPLTDADLAASYPAAGRLASYPSKKKWGSRKKKKTSMTYRPNSTLTQGERNSAKVLVRIDSAGSREGPRGQSTHGHGHGTEEDMGPSMVGHRFASTVSSHSFETADEESEYSNQQQPAGQPSPRSRNLLGSPTQPLFPRRRIASPNDPDADGHIGYLLTQRAGPSNSDTLPPMPPNSPPPAHFVQRSVQAAGTNPAYLMPGSHEGGMAGPSTFGERGTFGRSSESWHGGKAF